MRNRHQNRSPTFIPNYFPEERALSRVSSTPAWFGKRFSACSHISAHSRNFPAFQVGAGQHHSAGYGTTERQEQGGKTLAPYGLGHPNIGGIENMRADFKKNTGCPSGDSAPSRRRSSASGRRPYVHQQLPECRTSCRRRTPRRPFCLLLRRSMRPCIGRPLRSCRCSNPETLWGEDPEKP